MNNFVADSESAIRLSIFFAVLATLAILESIYPRRKLSYPRTQRWIVNFGISLFNSLFARLLLPVVGVGAALLAEERTWGLFNQIPMPHWLSLILFLLLFDLTIYLQHRMFHKIPWLWRLHRMHHTDLDYDVSTGNRFHPISIFLSSLIKLCLILALGPPVVAVLVAEVLLNVTSMFNHSNLHIPERVDALVRKLLVTPDMHRIHHSVITKEHNSNFGFNFPWWDRLFGTYQAQPHRGQAELDIGISGFQNVRSLNFFSLLLQPFK